jgi:hypothetical protein
MARLVLCAVAGIGCASVAMASTRSTSYSFGEDFNGKPLTQTVTTVVNTSATAQGLKYTLVGDAAYSVVAGESCGTTLAAHGICEMVVSFMPGASGAHNAVLQIGPREVGGTLQSQTVAITGASGALTPGTVTTTNNPQVAQYSITPPFAATVTINFGPTTAYGLNTWSQPADGTDALTMLVAGMKLNSTYHMQATVTLANGISVTDVDHTFTTTTYPNEIWDYINATTVSGAQLSPGIEMIDNTYGQGLQAYAVDLSANIIWGYWWGKAPAGTIPQPVKLLPNGHIFTALSYASQYAVLGGNPNALVVMQEVDLAGNVVKQITLDQLNTALTAAGYTGPALTDIHHDATVLPNGHWMLITNGVIPCHEIPNCDGANVQVIGDIIVDLDENLTPVWWWSEFDHLDINRRPMGFPDWTHSNTVLYSPTDGNLVISIRHQNWILKINYANGTGDGSILWHLGEGGDFTLKGGTDPVDWQYAQHKTSFASANTAGTFDMLVMDNGDDRDFGTQKCGGAGNPTCLYSTVPEFEINESTMTATIVWHDYFNYAIYSSWGGNADLLPNGNIEADFCDIGSNSDAYEIIPSSQEQIWHLHSTGQNLYRAERLGSMYPGITWTAD